MVKTPAIAPPMSPSHVFFGERRGASLWRPTSAPDEVRRRVGHEHGDDDGERDQPSLGVHLPQHEERAEPEPDPRRAEHGRPDGGRRRRAGLGGRVEEEREDERRGESAEQPLDLAALGADQREQHAEIDGGRKRAQLPRRRHELVDGDARGHRDEREQPPAAEPEKAEHDRQADDCDEDPRGEIAHSRCRQCRRSRSSPAESTPAARVLRRSRRATRQARSRARACR